MHKSTRRRKPESRPRYLEALIAVLRLLAAIGPLWQLWRP